MRDLNFVNSPLGVSPFVPSKKEWVATAIGAGAGLLSSFLGGLSASSAAKEAEKRQRAMEAKEDAWYNRNYYQDYLDTAAGQNLVRRARQMYDKNIKRAQGAAAVSGGTDASVQMAKDSANQALGDTMANIAAHDTARKSQVDATHMRNQQQFAQMDMNREMQRAQNITNAAQAASNAMMSVGAAVDQANTSKADLGGGSNNGQPDVKTAAPKLDTTSLSNMKSSHTNLMSEIEKENKSVLNGTI